MAENSGYPSLAALLGLLAVAGFQNRDKLSEWFSRASQDGSASAATSPSTGQSGNFSNILGPVAGGGLGGLLSNGLNDLVERFRTAGLGGTIDSWINTGENRPVDRTALSEALGGDMISELTRRTGMNRDELLRRLENSLPEAVDRYTPDGRVPRATEL